MIATKTVVGPEQRYDLTLHPPPDLVLEVEISRSVLDRLGIYAAMKIPEVWRWDGTRLRFCVLRRGGYVETDRSPSFPVLAAGEVERFLALHPTMSETKLLRAFRVWVREQQAAGWPTAPRPTRSRKSRASQDEGSGV